MFWDRVARPCLVVDASSTQSSGSVSPETFKECLTLLDQLCSMVRGATQGGTECTREGGREGCFLKGILFLAHLMRW